MNAPQRPIVIERLTSGDAVDLARLNRLLLGAFPHRRPVTREDLRATLEGTLNILLLARIGDEYAGMFTCLVQPCLGRYVSSMHDFAVDASLRNAGIGKALISRLFEELQSLTDIVGETVQPYCSANPSRAASNHLMAYAGMTQIAAAVGPQGTNFYKHALHPRLPRRT